jgi:hypothetical protein
VPQPLELLPTSLRPMSLAAAAGARQCSHPLLECRGRPALLARLGFEAESSVWSYLKSSRWCEPPPQEAHR